MLLADLVQSMMPGAARTVLVVTEHVISPLKMGGSQVFEMMMYEAAEGVLETTKYEMAGGAILQKKQGLFLLMNISPLGEALLSACNCQET